jgi:hypothetical protein
MLERRDHGLLEGDRTAGGSSPQRLRCGYFPPALRAFASRNKIAAPQPSSAGATALRVAPGAGPSRPPSQVIATKAAMGAADPAEDLP